MKVSELREALTRYDDDDEVLIERRREEIPIGGVFRRRGSPKQVFLLAGVGRTLPARS